MKISDGNNILQGKEPIENAFTRKNEAIRNLKEEKAKALQVVKAMLSEHTPYISAPDYGVDLSCTSSSNLSQDLTRKIAANLFCNQCSTRWPCNQVEPLRMLKRLLFDNVTSTDIDRADKYLAKPLSNERSSTIRIAL